MSLSCQVMTGFANSLSLSFYATLCFLELSKKRSWFEFLWQCNRWPVDVYFFITLLVFHPSLHVSGRKIISKLWCTVWDVYLVWCCQYYKRNGKLCSKIKSIPLLNNMEGKYRHKSTCLAFILFFILQYICTITHECHALYCVHIHS